MSIANNGACRVVVKSKDKYLSLVTCQTLTADEYLAYECGKHVLVILRRRAARGVRRRTCIRTPTRCARCLRRARSCRGGVDPGLHAHGPEHDYERVHQADPNPVDAE